MRVITESVVAAFKQVGIDANTLSEAELAQVDEHIAAKVDEAVNSKLADAVAAATADDKQRIADLEADMKAISDAVTNGGLTAAETVNAIGEITGAPVANADTGTAGDAGAGAETGAGTEGGDTGNGEQSNG